jgi:hypothetical protein
VEDRCQVEATGSGSHDLVFLLAVSLAFVFFKLGTYAVWLGVLQSAVQGCYS